MIQRIQTVYLSLSLLLCLSGFFMDWVVYHVGEASFVFSPMNFGEESKNTGLLTVLLGVLSALIAVSIFQFKSRKLQMRTVLWAMWLALLTFVAFGVVHYLNIQSLAALGATDMTYSFVVVVPILVSILCWMARKAIKKDDDLVRSVDRLR